MQVWVVADQPVADILEASLRSDPRLIGVVARIDVIDDFEIPSAHLGLSSGVGLVDEPPGGAATSEGVSHVLLVYASAIDPSDHSRRSQRGGCEFAARARRAGCRAPVVLVSFEQAETDLVEDSGEDHSTSEARLRLGGSEQPWFAPLYDQFLRLPCETETLAEAVNKAASLFGTRVPLVDAAIARAFECHFFDWGAKLDHECKGFEAVLRFLRGAQCDWAISPEDARAVTNALAATCKSGRGLPEGFDCERARAALSEQDKRWEDYERALNAACLPAPAAHEKQEQEGRLVYKLLLIDDQWDVFAWEPLLRGILSRDGFEVQCTDGKDYRERIPRFDPDVVLLDLHLAFPSPRSGVSREMEGLAILEWMRKNTPDVPVILFTATESTLLARQQQELGLVGYIVKSEAADRQDARGYYRRLRKLCKTAIDHRIRALLMAMIADMDKRKPGILTRIVKRLREGLSAVDSPSISCHSLSLALEELVEPYKAKDNSGLAVGLKGFLEHHTPPGPQIAAAHLARFIRNAVAHGARAADRLSVLDAHLMGLVVVMACFWEAGERIGSDAPELTGKALRLIRLRVADEIDAARGGCGGALQVLSPRAIQVLDAIGSEFRRNCGECAGARPCQELRAAGKWMDGALQKIADSYPSIICSAQVVVRVERKASSRATCSSSQMPIEWLTPVLAARGAISLSGSSDRSGDLEVTLRAGLNAQATGDLRVGFRDARGLETWKTVQVTVSNGEPKTIAAPPTVVGIRRSAMALKLGLEQNDTSEGTEPHLSLGLSYLTGDDGTVAGSVCTVLAFDPDTLTSDSKEECAVAALALARLIEWTSRSLISLPNTRSSDMCRQLANSAGAPGLRLKSVMDKSAELGPALAGAVDLAYTLICDAVCLAAGVQAGAVLAGPRRAPLEIARRVVDDYFPSTLPELELLVSCLESWIWTETGRRDLPLILDDLIARWTTTPPH